MNKMSSPFAMFALEIIERRTRDKATNTLCKVITDTPVLVPDGFTRKMAKDNPEIAAYFVKLKAWHKRAKAALKAHGTAGNNP